MADKDQTRELAARTLLWRELAAMVKVGTALLTQIARQAEQDHQEARERRAQAQARRHG